MKQTENESAKRKLALTIWLNAANLSIPKEQVTLTVLPALTRSLYGQEEMEGLIGWLSPEYGLELLNRR